MKMYVILVKSGRENAVCQEFEKRGFTAILPVKQEFIRYHGKWQIIDKNIFTNYIFIKCDISPEIYYEIKRIDGVIRFLGSEDEKNLHYLKLHEQHYIEWLWNSGNPIEPTKIYVTPSGDKLILSGILRNYPGNEIEYNLRQRKASVYIEIDGRKHRVTLPVIAI